ncbi:MFS transporter [Spirillospora sp. NPDC052269]
MASITAAPLPAVRPRRRWLVLGVGVAAQASFALGFAGLPVTGVTMREGYHLSTAGFGLAVGLFGLGTAASDLLWGLLTDRLGDRTVLLAGLGSSGLLMAVMAAAFTPADGAGQTALAIGLLLAGLLGGAMNSASGRAVMTWFGEDERGFAMSIRQTAIPAGGALGVALLPWLAAAHGYRAVFGVCAIVSLATAAATWFWLRDPGPEQPAPGTAAGRGPSPLRDPLVWRIALAGGLLTVPQFAVLSFAAIYLHDARGAAGWYATLTVAIGQLGGGAMRIWTGRFSDRRGNRRTLLRAVGVATAVAMGGAAVLTHAPVPVTVAGLTLAALLANAWHGLAYTEAAVTAGADRAGTALGLTGTTIFMAGFLTPLLIPAALHASSWTLVWAGTALAALAAVPLAPRRAR